MLDGRSSATRGPATHHACNGAEGEAHPVTAHVLRILLPREDVPVPDQLHVVRHADGAVLDVLPVREPRVALVPGAAVQRHRGRPPVAAACQDLRGAPLRVLVLVPRARLERDHAALRDRRRSTHDVLHALRLGQHRRAHALAADLHERRASEAGGEGPRRQCVAADPPCYTE